MDIRIFAVLIHILLFVINGAYKVGIMRMLTDTKELISMTSVLAGVMAQRSTLSCIVTSQYNVCHRVYTQFCFWSRKFLRVSSSALQLLWISLQSLYLSDNCNKLSCDGCHSAVSNRKTRHLSACTLINNVIYVIGLWNFLNICLLTAPIGSVTSRYWARAVAANSITHSSWPAIDWTSTSCLTGKVFLMYCIIFCAKL